MTQTENQTIQGGNWLLENLGWELVKVAAQTWFEQQSRVLNQLGPDACTAAMQYN